MEYSGSHHLLPVQAVAPAQTEGHLWMEQRAADGESAWIKRRCWASKSDLCEEVSIVGEFDMGTFGAVNDSVSANGCISGHISASCCCIISCCCGAWFDSDARTTSLISGGIKFLSRLKINLSILFQNMVAGLYFLLIPDRLR